MKHDEQSQFIDANFRNYLSQIHALELNIAIGYGLSSVVFSCSSLSQSQSLQQHESKYAIKLCDLSPLLFAHSRLRLRHQLECEVLQIFKENNQHQVVQIIKSGVYAEKIGYIVMQYLEGGHLGNLSTRIDNLRAKVNKQGEQTQSKCNTLIKQIVRAVVNEVLSILEMLQLYGVIHRDIKLENLLLSSRGEIKLIDFGTVYTHDQTHCQHKTNCANRWGGVDQLSRQLNTNDFMNGSRHYICPELISGKRKRVTSTKIDVWALGVMLFRLLTGAFPFQQLPSDNNSAYYSKIRSVQPIYPEQIEAYELEALQSCLQKDPGSRPAASQLRSKLIYFTTTDQQSLPQLLDQLELIENNNECIVFWKTNVAIKYRQIQLQFHDRLDMRQTNQTVKAVLKQDEIISNERTKGKEERRSWKEAQIFIVKKGLNNLIKIKMESCMRRYTKQMHINELAIERMSGLVIKLTPVQEHSGHEIKFDSRQNLQQFIEQMMSLNTKSHS